MRYYLGNIWEKNGEQEYYFKVYFPCKKNEKPEDILKKKAQFWYERLNDDGDVEIGGEPDGSGFQFDLGSSFVIVEPGTKIQEITKEEYNTLGKLGI